MTSSEIRSLAKVVALVTGGASGLGRATVARLVRGGASVVIADLPSSGGEKVAESIGGNCTFLPTDVSVATQELSANSAVNVMSIYNLL